MITGKIINPYSSDISSIATHDMLRQLEQSHLKFVQFITKYYDACDYCFNLGVTYEGDSFIEFNKKVYIKAREQFDLPSSVISRCIMIAWRELGATSNRLNIYNTPILVNSHCFNIKYCGNNYFMLTLKTGKRIIGQKMPEIQLLIPMGGYKKVVKEIATKYFKKDKLLFIKKDKDWHIQLTYSNNKKVRNKENIKIDIDIQLPEKLKVQYTKDETKALIRSIESGVISRYKRSVKKNMLSKSLVYLDITICVDDKDVILEHDNLEIIKNN